MCLSSAFWDIFATIFNSSLMNLFPRLFPHPKLVLLCIPEAGRIIDSHILLYSSFSSHNLGCPQSLVERDDSESW